ncbi:MAG: flagellar hook-associated protein FlgK [Brevinema sp.]
MISSFLGLEMGRGAMQTTQKGLQTVSHNLQNLNTEGYSRQRVTQKTMPALFPSGINKPNMPGQLGTGVTVEEVTRIRDIFLDDRIIAEKGKLGFWDQKKAMLHQMEAVFNEPGGANIRTDLEAFWESWQTVSEHPSDDAARIHLLERTKTLQESFKAQHYTLNDMRTQTNTLVAQKINDVNNIANTIATLNKQIQKQELLGDNPNDLYDKRDLLIDKLSSLADIRLERNSDKEFIVYIGAEKLIQGEYATTIEGYEDPDNLGFVIPRWKQTGQNIVLGQGEVSGLIEVRDQDLSEMIIRLDELVVGVIDSVNSVHKEGFGLNGETDNVFFRELTLAKNTEGAIDFNEDGVLDGTALYRITGFQKITNDTIIGTNGTLNFGVVNQTEITINYTASDTVENVIDRINRSGAKITAFLDHMGRFSIKAQANSDKAVPQFALHHLEDSGGFLTGLTGVLATAGQDGAYNWQNPTAIETLNTPRNLISLTPENNVAGWINLDNAVANKPSGIAAAQGYDSTGDGNPDIPTGFNDNRNALAIANLRFETIMTGRAATFDDYFQQTIAKAGTLSEQAIRSFDKSDAVSFSLNGLRSKVSGVSVDEEMTKMITLQHAYNAAARLVSTTDRLLDVIINRMGV